MGLFGKRKILDLTEDYRPQRKLRSKENTETSSTDTNSQETSSSGSFFDWVGGGSNTSSDSSPKTVGEIGNTNTYHGNFDPETGKPLNPNFDEKKKKLAIRLKSMTDRIEELSNQVYQLQQKIELLEKKINSGRRV
jgi:hypothetical protein